MARPVPDAATKPSATEGWSHARLIPTAGIRSELERERRASSCLLAVMHGVPEFGFALLRELGAPKSPTIETYAEVRCKDAAGKVVIPDGAIVCKRGTKRWACLVEVKTGTNALADDQVAAYLDVARDNGFDGVLTISNQITAASSESPVNLDGRKKRRPPTLWHFSWWRILTEAVVQSRYRGVSDPDQAWILRELIHYLSSEASGAMGFEDMGEHWVDVRRAAQGGTLRHGDTRVRAIAERWEQFTQYLCLSLSQELGRTVFAPRPRKQTSPERLDVIAKDLAATGELISTLRIPDAVGDLELRADVRARQTSTSVAVDAPREGRPKSRITWLLRQLDDAPGDLTIEAVYPNARQTIPASFTEAKDDPGRLLYGPDPAREPRSFRLTLSRAMGQKRGRAEGSFVKETSAQTVAFYRDLVQNIKPWQARAPKIREPEPGPEGAEEDEPPMLPAWSDEKSPEDATAADIEMGPSPPPASAN